MYGPGSRLSESFILRQQSRARIFFLRGGVDGGHVAERLLYSQFVHADDASDILYHTDDHAQLWNLAGMVADWLATLSYQERVIQMVAPEVIPELTVWGGNQMTIFERMGAKVVASPVDKAGGAG